MKNHKNNGNAYRLRENPKMSLKLSGSDCGGVSGQSQSKVSCKICGKAFLTTRQLCGHLRHHKIGELGGNLCNLCGKRFESVRGLCGHMKIHRSSTGDEESLRVIDEGVVDCSLFLIGNGVRRRARTPRFELHSYNLNLQQEKEELEQVAVSLIKLSEGIELCASADFSVNAVGNLVEVELFESTRSKSDGREKFDIGLIKLSEGLELYSSADLCDNAVVNRSDVGLSESARSSSDGLENFGVNLIKQSEGFSADLCDDAVVNRGDVDLFESVNSSSDGLEKFDGSLIKLSEGSKFCSSSDLSENTVVMNRAEAELFESMKSHSGGFNKLPWESQEMELDSGVIKDEIRCNVISDRHGKPEDDMCSVSGMKPKYICVSCNKGFGSHQALGGHRSAKLKLRRCSTSVLKIATCQSSHHIPAATGKAQPLLMLPKAPRLTRCSNLGVCK